MFAPQVSQYGSVVGLVLIEPVLSRSTIAASRTSAKSNICGACDDEPRQRCAHVVGVHHAEQLEPLVGADPGQQLRGTGSELPFVSVGRVSVHQVLHPVDAAGGLGPLRCAHTAAGRLLDGGENDVERVNLSTSRSERFLGSRLRLE